MTQATMARPHAPRRSVPPFSLIALVVSGALLCGGMALALRNSEVVSRVTIENRSSIAIDVDVRGSTHGDRLILQPVPPHERVSTFDVLDQGSEWVFGFSSGGVDGGSVRVSRDELATDGWRLVIPDRVVQRLQSNAFVPAYR